MFCSTSTINNSPKRQVQQCDFARCAFCIIFLSHLEPQLKNLVSEREHPWECDTTLACLQRVRFQNFWCDLHNTLTTYHNMLSYSVILFLIFCVRKSEHGGILRVTFIESEWYNKINTIQASAIEHDLKDDDLSRAGAELPRFDGPKKDGWRCECLCPQKKTLEN